MNDVIEFPRKELRTADANCIFRDVENGALKTYLRYTGSYEFEGNDWLIEIWATNIEEAQRKLAAISAGKIDGQVYSVVPA